MWTPSRERASRGGKIFKMQLTRSGHCRHHCAVAYLPLLCRNERGLDTRGDSPFLRPERLATSCRPGINVCHDFCRSYNQLAAQEITLPHQFAQIHLETGLLREAPVYRTCLLTNRVSHNHGPRDVPIRH